MTHYQPATEADVVDAVRASRAAKTPLRIIGGGTRVGFGRPVDAAATLSLGKLSGITLYEPTEMVIGARAGTPLAEVEATLADRGQMLPFEPVDHRALHGSTGAPSIGAVAAGNVSGPRRIAVGAARDSLIGVRFINGMGEAIKSGGRVMKNVTGLDLVKLQSGAFGTLGPLTEVIFKVLPRPETTLTLELSGLDDARAVAALSAGLTSPFEVSGAAHLPASGNASARTLMRLEGFAVSLAYRTGEMIRLLAPFGTLRQIPHEETGPLWLGIRNVAPLATTDATAIWRLSVKPSDGSKAIAAIASERPLSGHYYDWGGGLVWLATDAAGDAGAAVIRGTVARLGGHATLMRAPEAVRTAVSPFQPEGEAIARLSAGIRRSVDPDGLFNPGLMG